MKKITRKILVIYIAMILVVFSRGIEVQGNEENIRICGKINNEVIERIIDNCNNEINNYFEEYDINVNLDVLCIYLFEERTPEGNMGGYYNKSTPYNIYLNVNLIKDIDRLKFTYIHEVMHFIGFQDDDATMLMEGMADAIAEDILQYYYDDSYDIARELCHYMINNDHKAFQYIVRGGDIDDKIDYCLKDRYINPSATLEYKLKKIEDGELDSVTYDRYVKECKQIISLYCASL